MLGESSLSKLLFDELLVTIIQNSKINHFSAINKVEVKHMFLNYITFTSFVFLITVVSI